MTNKSEKRTMACLFVNTDDYERFCNQINRQDLIKFKGSPRIHFNDLKKTLFHKPTVENFYE